eukprot:1969063-Amphidinium_carterae.1
MGTFKDGVPFILETCGAGVEGSCIVCVRHAQVCKETTFYLKAAQARQHGVVEAIKLWSSGSFERVRRGATERTSMRCIDECPTHLLSESQNVGSLPRFSSPQHPSSVTHMPVLQMGDRKTANGRQPPILAGLVINSTFRKVRVICYVRLCVRCGSRILKSAHPNKASEVRVASEFLK